MRRPETSAPPLLDSAGATLLFVIDLLGPATAGYDLHTERVRVAPSNLHVEVNQGIDDKAVHAGDGKGFAVSFKRFERRKGERDSCQQEYDKKKTAGHCGPCYVLPVGRSTDPLSENLS